MLKFQPCNDASAIGLCFNIHSTVYIASILLVTYYAVSIKANVPPVVTFLGRVAILNCPLDGTDPVEQIYWRTPDGDILKASNDRYEVRGSALYIDESDKSFAGVYQCVIIDTTNHVFKADIQLVIQSCADAKICLNDGICVTTLGSGSTKDHIRCECRVGFTGDICQDELVAKNLLIMICGLVSFVIACVITCCCLYRSHHKRAAPSAPSQLTSRPQPLGAESVKRPPPIGPTLDREHLVGGQTTDLLQPPPIGQLRHTPLSLPSSALQPDGSEVGLLQPSVSMLRSLEAAEAGLISSPDLRSVTPSASRILSTDHVTDHVTDSVVTSSPVYGTTPSPTTAVTSGRRSAESTGSRANSSDGGYNTSATTGEEGTLRSHSTVRRHKANSSRAVMGSSSDDEKKTSEAAGSGRQFPLIRPRRGISTRISRSRSRTPYDSVSNVSRDSPGQNELRSVISPSSQSWHSESVHLEASPKSRPQSVPGLGDAGSPPDRRPTGYALHDGCSGEGSEEACDSNTWHAIFRMRGETMTYREHDSAAGDVQSGNGERDVKSSKPMTARHQNNVSVSTRHIRQNTGLLHGGEHGVLPGGERRVLPGNEHGVLQAGERGILHGGEHAGERRVLPGKEHGVLHEGERGLHDSQRFVPNYPNYPPPSASGGSESVSPRSNWMPANESRMAHGIEKVDGVGRNETVYHVAPKPPWVGVASPLDIPLQPSLLHFDGVRGEHVEMRGSVELIADDRMPNELAHADMSFEPSTSKVILDKDDWKNMLSEINHAQPSSSGRPYRTSEASNGVVPEPGFPQDDKISDDIMRELQGVPLWHSEYTPMINTAPHFTSLTPLVGHDSSPIGNASSRDVSARSTVISPRFQRELTSREASVPRSSFGDEDHRARSNDQVLRLARRMTRSNPRYMSPATSALLRARYQRNDLQPEVSSFVERFADANQTWNTDTSRTRPADLPLQPSRIIVSSIALRNMVPKTADLLLPSSGAGSPPISAAVLPTSVTDGQQQKPAIQDFFLHPSLTKTAPPGRVVVSGDSESSSDDTMTTTTVVTREDTTSSNEQTKLRNQRRSAAAAAAHGAVASSTSASTEMAGHRRVSAAIDAQPSLTTQDIAKKDQLLDPSLERIPVKSNASVTNSQPSLTTKGIATKDQILSPSVEQITEKSNGTVTNSLKRRDSVADNRTSNASGVAWNLSEETGNTNSKKMVDEVDPSMLHHRTSFDQSRYDVNNAARPAPPSQTVNASIGKRQPIANTKDSFDNETPHTVDMHRVPLQPNTMTSSVINDSTRLSRDLQPHGLLDLSPSKRQRAVEPEEVREYRLVQTPSNDQFSSLATGNENWNSLSTRPKNLKHSLLSSVSRAADYFIQLDKESEDALEVSLSLDFNSTKESKDAVLSPAGVRSPPGRDFSSAPSPSRHSVDTGKASSALQRPPLKYERSFPHLEHVPLIADIAMTLTSSVSARSASYSAAHGPEIDRPVNVSDSSSKLHYVVATNKLEPEVLIASLSRSMDVGKSLLDVGQRYDNAGAPELQVSRAISLGQADEDNMLQSSVTRFQSGRIADDLFMTSQPSSPTVDVRTTSRHQSSSPKSADVSSRHDRKLAETLLGTMRNSRFSNAAGIQSRTADVDQKHDLSVLEPSQSNLLRRFSPSALSSLWIDITESVKTSYPPDKVQLPSRLRSSEMADTTSGRRYLEGSPLGPRENTRTVTFFDQQPTTPAAKSVTTSLKKSSSFRKDSPADKLNDQLDSSRSKKEQNRTLMSGTNRTQLSGTKKSTGTSDYKSIIDHRASPDPQEDSGDEKILWRLRKEVENYRNRQSTSLSIREPASSADFSSPSTLLNIHEAASSADYSSQSKMRLVNAATHSEELRTLPSHSNVNQSAREDVNLSTWPGFRESESARPSLAFSKPINPDMSSSSFHFDAPFSSQTARGESSSLQLPGTTSEDFRSGHETPMSVAAGSSAFLSPSHFDAPHTIKSPMNSADLQLATSRWQLSGLNSEDAASGHDRHLIDPRLSFIDAHDSFSPSSTRGAWQMDDSKNILIEDRSNLKPSTLRLGANTVQHPRTSIASQLGVGLTPSRSGQVANSFLLRDFRLDEGLNPSTTGIVDAARLLSMSFNTGEDMNSMPLSRSSRDFRLDEGLNPSTTGIVDAARLLSMSFNTGEDMTSMPLLRSSREDNVTAIHDRFLPLSEVSFSHRIPSGGVQLSGTEVVDQPSMSALHGHYGIRDDYTKPSSTHANKNQSSKYTHTSGTVAKPSQTRLAGQQIITDPSQTGPSQTHVAEQQRLIELSQTGPSQTRLVGQQRLIEPSQTGPSQTHVAEQQRLIELSQTGPSQTRLVGQQRLIEPSQTGPSQTRLTEQQRITESSQTGPSQTHLAEQHRIIEPSQTGPSQTRLTEQQRITESSQTGPSQTHLAEQHRIIEPSQTGPSQTHLAEQHRIIEPSQTGPSQTRLAKQQRQLDNMMSPSRLDLIYSSSNNSNYAADALISPSKSMVPTRTLNASVLHDHVTQSVAHIDDLRTSKLSPTSTKRTSMTKPSDVRLVDLESPTSGWQSDNVTPSAVRVADTATNDRGVVPSRTIKESTLKGDVSIRPSVPRMRDDATASRDIEASMTPSATGGTYEVNRSCSRYAQNPSSLLLSNSAHMNHVFRGTISPSIPTIGQGFRTRSDHHVKPSLSGLATPVITSGAVTYGDDGEIGSDDDPVAATPSALIQTCGRVNSNVRGRELDQSGNPSTPLLFDGDVADRGGTTSRRPSVHFSDDVGGQNLHHKMAASPSRTILIKDAAASQSGSIKPSSLSSKIGGTASGSVGFRASTMRLSPGSATESSNPVASRPRGSLNDNLNATSRRDSTVNQSMTLFTSSTGANDSVSRPSNYSFHLDEATPCGADTLSGNIYRPSTADVKDEGRRVSLCDTNFSNDVDFSDSLGVVPSAIRFASTSGEVRDPNFNTNHRMSGTMKPSTLDITGSSQQVDNFRLIPSVCRLVNVNKPVQSRIDESAVCPSLIDIKLEQAYQVPRHVPSSLAMTSSQPLPPADCSYAVPDVRIDAPLADSIRELTAANPDNAATIDVVSRNRSVSSSSMLTTKSGYRLCSPAEAASSRRASSRNSGSTVRAAVEAIEHGDNHSNSLRTQSENNCSLRLRHAPSDIDSCRWNSYFDACEIHGYPSRSSSPCYFRPCSVTNSDVSYDVIADCASWSQVGSSSNRFNQYRTPPMYSSIIEPHSYSTVAPPSDQGNSASDHHALHHHSRSLPSLPSNRHHHHHYHHPYQP